MSDIPRRPPPLPPSSLPDDLLARCRIGLVAATVRSSRATLEVHRTHLRICCAAVDEVTTYARRMNADDLVLAFDEISSIRPVGLMTAVVELPRRAAIALTGPSVRATLAHVDEAVPVEPRRFRPFFVGFWLIGHRPGRVEDSRPLP